MNRGVVINIARVAPTIALLLMLFLLSASCSQPPHEEGAKTTCGTCNNSSNVELAINLQNNSPLTATTDNANNTKLGYEIISQPRHGTLIGTAPNVVYTPDKGYSGNDTFAFITTEDKVNKQIVTVAIDVTQLYHPPSVRITCPQDGAIFTANPTTKTADIPIRAYCVGEKPTVEFFADSNKIGDNVCPGRLTWTGAIGPHILTAKATDDQGNMGSSLPVEITINPPEPTVRITHPDNGVLFAAPASITITAEAVDSNGIKKVEFFEDSSKLGEDNVSPYSFTWTNVMPGFYHLKATATSVIGDSSISSPVLIVVKSVNPASKADLAITLNQLSNPVQVGGYFYYVITVTNRGPGDATNIIVNFIPTSVSYVNYTASQGRYNNETGVWEVGSLQPQRGAESQENSARLVVLVKADNLEPGTLITNAADVAGAEPDPDNSNNYATIYTRVRG